MPDFEDFMNKIGFSGCGDHTGGGLTVFLTLVFTTLTALFVGSVVDYLLTDYPMTQEALGNTVSVFIILGIIAVISFFVVFWRHIPLIVLFSLCSAIGIFNIICMVTTENGEPFPPAISARFQPSEERLKEIQAMKAVRIATVKDSYFTVTDLVQGTRRTTLFGEPVTPGSIVIITLNPKGSQHRYTIQYRGTENTIRYISDFKLMRMDRAAFLRHECSLLAWSADDADPVKDIPGGERVALTGKVFDDALTVEVTHNGDTGWLRLENLKQN